MHIENISLNYNTVEFDISGKRYSIPGRKIPFYNGTIVSIQNDADKIKLLTYLLTSQHPVIKIRPIQGQVKRKWNSAISKTEVRCDPDPDHFLEIRPFRSLESVQWHLLSHGLVDYWIKPWAPYLFSEILNEDNMPVLWNKFKEEVQCERWAFDLLGMEQDERRKKWEDLTTKYSKDCYDCIKDQGIDRFLQCCRLFEEIRIHYLKRIKKWVVDTIQDNDFVPYYCNSRDIPAGKIANRKHIHLYDGRGSMYAYVFEQDKQKTDIYKMIFDLDRYLSTRNRKVYWLKTAYGLRTIDLPEEPWDTMYQNAERAAIGCRQPSIYCHVSNWDAKKYG